MKYTTFNIGLNNNPFSYENVAKIIIGSFSTSNESVEVQLSEGEYKEGAEPTAVVKVVHGSYQDAIWAQMMSKTLCGICTQECIPYRYVEYQGDEIIMVDELVYNENFEGEKYDFDEAYFIGFADKVN